MLPELCSACWLPDARGPCCVTPQVSTERLRADMRYAQELEADLEALKVCDDDIYAAGNDRQAGSMSGGQHRF